MSTEKKNKVSKKLLFSWPTATISTGVAAAFVGYVTFFATDYLGIDALTAGMVFMVSKIFDGITDLVAGYLIDRTNTKLGKGRPYDLAIIGYWLTIVAMFAAPQMGITPSVIYLFVMYTLCNSVFLTLWTCGNTVYLANALENPEQSVSVLSFNGIITMIFSMVAAIAMPQVVSNFCHTRTDWAVVSIVLAIPCTLVGLIRFFVVKERKDIISARAVTEKITIKDMVGLRLSQPHALMTSYNLINGRHASERYDLIEGILRSEFGFKGIAMTDWTIEGTADKSAVYPEARADRIAGAGVDLVMPGSAGDYKNMQTALKDGTLSRARLQENATRVYAMIKKLRGEK